DPVSRHPCSPSGDEMAAALLVGAERPKNKKNSRPTPPIASPPEPPDEAAVVAVLEGLDSTIRHLCWRWGRQRDREDLEAHLRAHAVTHVLPRYRPDGGVSLRAYASPCLEREAWRW